ncbi:MAG: RagB/SusD family nutrient uptake outer membrane protein [Tannerellaceae bacterium]|nr:RagB/SusD family nutrient uptake outer membrane protein [Tannerellaceae bacterium]
MKKSILYIIIFLLSLGCYTGCSFLDENPVDRLVEGNFYTNEKDAQAAVDATYTQLNDLYNRLMYMLCELPTDNMKNGLGMPNAFLQDLEYLRHTSENTFVKDMWKHSYAGISKANTAIEKIPDIDMNATKQARFIGEAKFLRGLYYFNLVRFFGDVPLITNLQTIEDALGPRTPKEEVYRQIIEDVTYAADHLPYRSEYGSSDAGRVNKGAAKILLGKIYLTRGEFQKAADVLAEVVENESIYGFGLHDNYHNNWLRETEAGIEAVFYIEYLGPPYRNNGEMSLAGPKYSIPGDLGISALNEADIPTQELYDLFDDRDTRKAVNFKTEFTHLLTGEVLESSIPLSGKFWVEGLESGDLCDVNVHIIRYADALLMYAEALNEIGESSKALTVLNRIRERAYGDTSGNYSPMSQEEFRKVVWNERRLEFPHEGHRWFDLVRTGTFVERMKEHSEYEARVAESNKTDIAKNLKEHMVLMPIPQSEIDLNPELTQNPGW